jgi:hypothetical protein
MRTLELTMTGTRPILMHNAERLLNPFDAANREKKQITDKKTKQTDDDRIMVARLEWTLSWHWDDVLGPVMPTQMIYAALHAASRKTRDGAQFRDAVSDATENGIAPLVYDGPRTLDELWGIGLDGSPYVDYRPVGQQQAKIMRCRPKLPSWSVTTEWEVDETILDIESFVRFADKAGALCGVGDYRLMYGRFDAIVKELECV